jgi:DNA-binding NarL/FixJ family response regulator
MNDEHVIRVLIVEDHHVVRSGLRRLLEDAPGIQVVGDTDRGEDVLRLVAEHVPHVVLLDLVLDGSQVDGLEVIQQIVSTSPTTRIMVLSAYSDESLVRPALRYGARGYLLKRALPEEVIRAIEDVAHNEYCVDRSILENIFKQIPEQGKQEEVTAPNFTSREIDVLRHLTRGLTNAAIAQNLCISPATVKTHVSNILRKLDLHDRDRISGWIVQNNPKLLSTPDDPTV